MGERRPNSLCHDSRMRATTLHGLKDIRFTEVPDPAIEAPTDAIVRVVASCICGSDLWNYRGDNKITPGMTDFSSGPGPKTLEVPGAPLVSPLICYEAIFPGAVTEDGKRPGWLLNVTNDAWFGESAGPYQHFSSARVRATPS